MKKLAPHPHPNILATNISQPFTFLVQLSLNLSKPFWREREREEMMMHHQPDHLPCLYCQPQSFIRMVQHLIERCLLSHMTRDDCVRALAKHACIQPLVTVTVWEELVKENKGFFQAYNQQVISPAHFNNHRPNERVLNLRRRRCTPPQ